MAKSLDITAFINEFSAKAVVVLDKLDKELENGLEDVVSKAKSKAPNDIKGNNIGNSIGLSKEDKFNYTISVNNPYAAYYEFGTGPSAKAYLPSIPKVWNDIAEDYIINEKGTINESAYLYPSYNEELPKIIERMKKVIKDA
jgi:Bacteriophage HK97-gp10, putative tail-component